jgi:hypothetical protein
MALLESKVKRGEATVSADVKQLEDLVRELTPEARSELRDFAEFLWHRQKRVPKHGLRQDWAGALREQREQYTSVELQHKAVEWRGD